MLSYVADMWTLALDGDKQAVLFFCSVYAAVTLGYSAVRQAGARGWPTTRGVLAEAAVKKFGATEWAVGEQDYRVAALYTYQVNGETYEGKRVSPWVVVASHNARFILQRQLSRIRRLEGNTVEVFFNPARPGKSFLVRPGKFGLSVTFVLAVAPLAVYWYAYHA